jgi:hypothetical protein
MLIAEKLKRFSTFISNSLKVFRSILVKVTVDFTFSWFVNLGSLLFGSDFDELSDLSSFDIFNVEKEAHNSLKGFRGSLDNIFESNNMCRDVLVQPPGVEFFPDTNLLVYKLCPGTRESLEIIISHRAVMRSCADHVKKGGNTIQRTSD